MNHEPTRPDYSEDNRRTVGFSSGPPLQPSRPQPQSSRFQQAPDVIGPYHLIRELGRGGIGIVYEAIHQGLNRRVALKTILSTKQENKEALERFEIEAHSMARLRHPNIVPIYDVGKDSGMVYLAMELASSGTLADRLKAQGKLEVQEALTLCAKLASGLHHAHTQNIIHRDMKPSNVLSSENGEPLITDFGLAKRIDEDRDISKTGALLGTLSYMPPEQLEGKHCRIDGRADVYALGATLYEMLTGEPPFAARQGQELLVAILVMPPPKLSDSSDDKFPSEVETILTRCLAKDPDDRYETAADLAEDCRRVLVAEDIVAQPFSLGERFRHWTTRNRSLAISLAMVFAALPVLLVVLALTYAHLKSEGEGLARLAEAKAVQARNRAIAAEKESRRARNQAEIALAQAKRAEGVARQRFKQVHDLSKFFLIDFDALIARLPGSTQARKILVNKSLAYIEQLSQVARDDPALNLDLAIAYRSVGDITGGTHTTNLGDVRSAEKHYKAALVILEGEFHDRPNYVVQKHLGITLASLAALQLSQGNSAAAIPKLQQVDRLLEALVKVAPKDVAERTELVATISYAARMHQDLKHKAAAEKLYILATTVIADSIPFESAEALTGQGAAQNNLGRFYGQNGELEKAARCYANSVRFCERATKKSPNDFRLKHFAATLLENQGQLLMRLKRVDEGLKSHKKASEFYSQAAENDPGNVQLAKAHGQSIQKRADYYKNLAGDLIDARKEAEAAVIAKVAWRLSRDAGQVLEKAHRLAPNDLVLLRALVNSYESQGYSGWMMTEGLEALKGYQLARNRARGLEKTAETRARYRVLLARLDGALVEIRKAAKKKK
ncbi:MAG: protein kinase [Planctomycetota bacterium]|nr:protein kinase [Planctomycetota bacterium]